MADGVRAREVKDLYAVGEIPPEFHVPKTMHAWAIRRERHGRPKTAMQLEVVPTPEIASVTKRKVLQSGAEQTLLRVRYSYFDPSRSGAASWSQVLIASKPCTGFAERDFTLERAKLGYRVVDMSGPRRVP